MFKSKINEGELIMCIYTFGYNQYQHLFEYFEQNNIKFDSNYLFINSIVLFSVNIFKIIIEKMPKKIKMNLNISDETSNLINQTFIDNLQSLNIDSLRMYVSDVDMTYKKLIGKGNTKILDTVEFFLNDIEVSLNDNQKIKDFLINLFANWHNICLHREFPKIKLPN